MTLLIGMKSFSHWRSGGVVSGFGILLMMRNWKTINIHRDRKHFKRLLVCNFCSLVEAEKGGDLCLTQGIFDILVSIARMFPPLKLSVFTLNKV